LLYIGTFVYVIFNRKALGNRRALYIGLLLALVGALIIFGIGVSNAGTAVRHRQKLIAVFLILLAITKDAKMRRKESAMLLDNQSPPHFSWVQNNRSPAEQLAEPSTKPDRY
jgi:hypothetical protein